jgi:CBS domain-containing protein
VDERAASVTTLGEIMSREVLAAAPGASVSEVAGDMLRRRVGSAVVTGGSMLLGILTERDVLRAAASGVDLTSSAVSEWMTLDPATADPSMDAERAIEVMMSGGFRHLPVLQDGSLVGVVSLRDLVRTRVARGA